MAKQKKKPTWPYSHVTRMTAHPTGRWCKKIAGKLHYFGPWDDPAGALEVWRRTGDDLLAGRKPRVEASDREAPTVGSVVNEFLHHKHSLMDAGELSVSTWKDYTAIGGVLVDTLGRHTLVDSLGPEDFRRLRATYAKRYGVYQLGKAVTVTRSVFRWATDEAVIDRPVPMGRAFRKPKATDYRRARNVKAGQTFTPAQIHKLLEAAQPQLAAMILLGVNCGFGNTDCSELRQSHLQLSESLVVFPRPKTEIQRACVLWPETVSAIQRAQLARPAPRQGVDPERVFITPYGYPWVRERTVAKEDGRQSVASVDAVGRHFTKLVDGCDLSGKGLTFYRLRHTFRTVADQLDMQHPVYRIMGHALPGLSEHYVHEIERQRIAKVTDHVRSWLFGGSEALAKIG